MYSARLSAVIDPGVGSVCRLAAAFLAVACLAAGCASAGTAGRGPGAVPHSSRVLRAPSGPSPSPTKTVLAKAGPARIVRAGSVPAIGDSPARIAGQLSAAELRLSGSDGAGAVLARQALIVELACLRAAVHPGWTAAVITRLRLAARAQAIADLTATEDLVELTPPAAGSAQVRIIAADHLATLRAYYRAAQAATGVGWSYLAAINFVETDFGRVAGPSSAGAQGPMQFLPATWAEYGHGDIHRAGNAIRAAARFLAAHGATRDIGSALYAYNPSKLYVDAVLRYASRLRKNRHALAGYYDRQVLYHSADGWVLLPFGYGHNPAVRAVPLRLR